MKKLCFVLFLGLAACVFNTTAPKGFKHRELQTSRFKLASWQKKTDETKPVRIYIEGDSSPFKDNSATYDTLIRDLAFNDPNANVVYLARPCQYVEEDDWCSPSDWGDGRFSKPIIDSMTEAVNQIARGRPVILIGYSESAMISGLMISRNPDMRVQKWITIAGVLNHGNWTKHLKMRPLVNSLDLTVWPNVPQVHFVGGMDTIVPPTVVASYAPNGTVLSIPQATHNTGFETIYPLIYE